MKPNKLPQTSIIIRTKNEQRYLEQVLKIVFEQTDQDFEVIVIDSGSTDHTLEIAKKYPVKILQIPPQDFTYPYALNHACQRASASKYFIFLSAHSIPISKTWVADGLENFQTHPKIMGVYGMTYAIPDTSVWDKIVYFGLNFVPSIIEPERMVVKKGGVGIMGFTNAIILKELWEKKHFNEDYGLGGEDGEWISSWFKKGYQVIKDRRFSVYHSHNLGLCDWMREWRYWYELGTPKPFTPLTHRIKHKK